MESGWDPDVKRFFIRILNTISIGLLWLLIATTAGFYFKLALPGERPLWVVIIYYVLLVLSLVFLLRYYQQRWNKRS